MKKTSEDRKIPTRGSEHSSHKLRIVDNSSIKSPDFTASFKKGGTANMCRTIHQYDCGHTRKYKVKCHRRGAVSAFFHGVLNDEGCKHTMEKHRNHLCPACDSHYEENHQIRKEAKRAERASRHRDDLDGRGRRRRPSYHSHRTRSAREAESRAEHRHESLKPQETPEPTDYSTWRTEREASRPTNTQRWVDSLGTESSSSAHRRSSRISHAAERAQENTETETPESSTPGDMAGWTEAAPAQAPETSWGFLKTPSPSSLLASSHYTPARVEWAKIPSPPDNTYQPSTPPRPPSSIYPSVASFPAASSYSAANMSDFFTVYVDTEVGAEQEAQAQEATQETSPLQTQDAVETEPKANVQRKWPRPPPPPKQSRFANLAGTTSESMAQEESRAKAEKRAEAQRNAKPNEKTESQLEQERWKQAVGGWKADMEKEASEEYRRHRSELNGSSSHRRERTESRTRPHQPCRSESKRPAHDVRDPLRRAATNVYRGRSNGENPGTKHPHSVPEKKPEKIWDPVLRRYSPMPTPSSVGSQVWEHPRVAPPFPPPSPERSAKTNGRSSERRRSHSAETTVSMFHPLDQCRDQRPHTANPRVVEENRRASKRNSAKRSRHESKRSPRPKESPGSSGSPRSSRSEKSSRSTLDGLNQIGKDMLGKFGLRKQPSEASFMCVDAARHDAQYYPPTLPPESRRKPQAGLRAKAKDWEREF